MDVLRVMSFNVRVVVGVDDGVNSWGRRAEINAKVIERYAPDLIGFQELQPPHWESYERLLPTLLPRYGRVLGVPYNNHEPKYAYPSIFWRSDRFELVDEGAFWLSSTPQEHSRGWDAVHVRSATWARLRPRRTQGRDFVILNTHLDNHGVEARTNSAELIIRRMAQISHPDEPVIITGDFNSNPDAPPCQRFIAAGYQDTYEMVRGVQPAYTYHEFTGDHIDDVDKRRIDWILLRDDNLSLKVKEADIIRDAQPPIYPSDHFPIVTEFEVA